MTKRRDVIRYFENHGFWSVGGTKHEKFTNGRTTIMIKRHREIEDEVFRELKKQAGRPFIEDQPDDQGARDAIYL